MDKQQIFSLLDGLADKKEKIKEAREKLNEKRNFVFKNEEITFDNIDNFLSNNSESLEQLERMEQAISLLEKQFENDEWEISSVIFKYIFEETKRLTENRYIYKRYQKKLKQILNAYDEIQNLKKEVEEINKSVVKELSQKYPLSRYRTEVYPHTILPFFIPDYNGDLEFKNDYRKAKEYLENS